MCAGGNRPESSGRCQATGSGTNDPITDRLSVGHTEAMPRTLDPVAHRVRRDAFLDAAQTLIQTKGYEAMSIQDVLDAVEASRGAFYHYFDSKQALLEAVVDRFADAAIAAFSAIVADPAVPADQKLEQLFRTMARVKAEQKALVLAILEIWISDANAIVREKVRRMTTRRLVPVLTEVVRQGVDEGVFTAASPEETAMVIVFLMQGYQELAVEHFIGAHAGTVSLDVVRRAVAAHTEALERILGAPTGSLSLMDEATLQFWFG
jgi:AcrR family transcriptional regulator